MHAIEHPVKNYLQPTNDSCGYGALATLLSFYEKDITPEQLILDVPEARPEGKDAYGSVTSQLAAWCVNNGFNVQLTTFDFLIIDLEWAKLQTPEEIIERLEAVKDVRNVVSLGDGWSKVYAQEYIKYLRAGGRLEIKPHVTTDLLYEMLEDSPVFVNVSPAPLYNSGRQKSSGLRESVANDTNGHVGTHSVVIYGCKASGEFLLADPWYGLTTVDPETLICAITASQIECDAMCFQIFPKR